MVNLGVRRYVFENNGWIVNPKNVGPNEHYT